MKLYIFPNDRKTDQIGKALSVIARLESTGYQCVMRKKTADHLGLDESYIGEAEDCDMIVAVGGDGAVLRASQVAYRLDKPLLGINAGTLGYLCAHDVNSIPSDILEGTVMTERAVLKTVLKGQKHYAFNDFVIYKRNLGTTVRLKVGYKVKEKSFKADGLIISTPTGSTSYNLSAGGPVVDYDVNVKVVTPICCHDAEIRPTIISSKHDLKISTYEGYDDGATIYADGARVADLPHEIVIATAKRKLKLYK